MELEIALASVSPLRIHRLPIKKRKKKISLLTGIKQTDSHIQMRPHRSVDMLLKVHKLLRNLHNTLTQAKSQRNLSFAYNLEKGAALENGPYNMKESTLSISMKFNCEEPIGLLLEQ